MTRARLKLIALVVGTVAASALMAWVITDAVTNTQDTAGMAAQRAVHATAQGCYETDRLLWNLDRSSYAGYQRDTAAVNFIRAVGKQVPSGVAQIVQVFGQAAQDAYWQPLLDCTQAARHPAVTQLAAAVPVSTVPKQTIQRVLAHPPAPPTSG